MEATRIIPAGTLVNFTSGAYSDFGLEATGVALKDCDIVAAVREWGATLADYTYRDAINFISWLFGKSGYFVEAEVATWYLGAYQAGEGMSYDPPKEATDDSAL